MYPGPLGLDLLSGTLGALGVWGIMSNLRRAACRAALCVASMASGTAFAQVETVPAAVTAPSPAAAAMVETAHPVPPAIPGQTRYHAESVSPFGRAALPENEPAGLTMPAIAFEPTGLEAKDFDKYYVFHRPDTDFATAYGDIIECDGYARGLSGGVRAQDVPYPYAGTMGGAIGGAIGNALAVAIFGSAEKRKLRRINMRKCMNFKGYDRYGLPKQVWEAFNFEEGFSGVDDDDRLRFLKQQAMVASAPEKPRGEAQGL